MRLNFDDPFQPRKSRRDLLARLLAVVPFTEDPRARRRSLPTLELILVAVIQPSERKARGLVAGSHPYPVFRALHSSFSPSCFNPRWLGRLLQKLLSRRQVAPPWRIRNGAPRSALASTRRSRHPHVGHGPIAGRARLHPTEATLSNRRLMESQVILPQQRVCPYLAPTRNIVVLTQLVVQPRPPRG